MAPPATAPLPSAAAQPRRSRGSSALPDLIFRLCCQAAAILTLVVPALLVAILIWQSWEALSTIGLSFLTSTIWDPVDEPGHRIFGALAFVYGTVVTSAIAMVVAVPLGVGTAAFLSEIASSWVRRVATFFIEMLAAIPSVVYGFWGVAVLAPLLRTIYLRVLGTTTPGGLGMLAAGLILAIMIVPYIAAISFDVCQAVPRSQREGALALGATRWQTIWSVVLPYARPGIVGGCFLALGRALGETMAVTMLIGNKPEIVFSPVALGDSIASVIANQYVEASYPLYRSVLVELGLLLLVVSVVINIVARLLLWRVGRGSAMLGVGRLGRLPSDVFSHRPRLFSARQVNALMTGMLGLCLVMTMGMLVLILTYVLYEGIGSLRWTMFTNLPLDEPPGMANGFYGSFKIVGAATLFAVPVGILAAIYLAEYRNNTMSGAVRFVGELLGGVPSIIIGIFAAALFGIVTEWSARVFGKRIYFYGWSGVFALGVMMVPIVMRASEEALKLVPTSLRNASYALGASRAQTVLRVTVPAALPAIITGVFLSIARIAGETAPLLLTALMTDFWPKSLHDRTPSIPTFIYTYARRPSPEDQAQAWGAALVLVGVVLLINIGIRFATGKRVVQASRAD